MNADTFWQTRQKDIDGIVELLKKNFFFFNIFHTVRWGSRVTDVVFVKWFCLQNFFFQTAKSIENKLFFFAT